MYLLFLISATYGLVHLNIPELTAAITLVIAIALMFGGTGYRNKRPLVYIISAIAVLTMLLSGQPVTDVLAQSISFTLTILLVVSVSLISVLINPSGSFSLFSQVAEQFRIPRSTNMVMCSAVVASPFLNMATPMVYGQAFSGGGDADAHIAAMNIKRGMMVAMLFAPTFAPIALVLGSHPGVLWQDTLVFTIPMAAATLVWFSAINNYSLDMPAAPEKPATVASTGLQWVLLYIVLLGAVIQWLEEGIIGSIIVSAQATAIIAVLFNWLGYGGTSFSSLDRKCREATKKLNNEGLIFVASGVILVSGSHFISPDSWFYTFVSTMPSYLLIPVVILVLPLLGILNMHPIIGFTLLQPMVYMNQDLVELQKYLLWLCYWVVSLQISPISVINLTTSHAFGVVTTSLTDWASLKLVYLLGVFYSFLILAYGVLLK